MQIEDRNPGGQTEEERIIEAKQRATRSVYSYKSGISNASRKSYMERVEAEKKREQETKSQWNDSMASSQRELTTEDRIAQKIANEVLKDNQKLRGIHSTTSIKKLLEREAKKQLLLEHDDGYRGPIVSKISLKDKEFDASNLPYLHKHPAV